MDKITKLQQRLHSKIRSTPAGGVMVRYLKWRFLVLPGVFRPFDDSKVLTKYLLSNSIIQPGMEVCDVCTGSGVLAVIGALQGAFVTAVDINPAAVRNARINALIHDVEHLMSVQKSDVWSTINKKTIFDVVVANLPFRKKESADEVEATTWDRGFKVHQKFFEGLMHHTTIDSRIFLARPKCERNQRRLEALAAEYNYTVVTRGTHKKRNDPRTFYVCELV